MSQNAGKARTATASGQKISVTSRLQMTSKPGLHSMADMIECRHENEIIGFTGLFCASLPVAVLLIAYEPAFPIAPFENVNVHNLMCATLGLKPARNDGDDRLLKKMLAP